jgi:hypothetical protein
MYTPMVKTAKGVKGTLEAHGFRHMTVMGTTRYGGVYSRADQTVTVTVKPGLGDVSASVGNRVVIAECKGGVVNSSHQGQLSRLRRGLCETVGLLMARPLNGERQVAVVPATGATRTVAMRMMRRALVAGIEIALVGEDGKVEFVAPAEGGAQK